MYPFPPSQEMDIWRFYSLLPDCNQLELANWDLATLEEATSFFLCQYKGFGSRVTKDNFSLFFKWWSKAVSEWGEGTEYLVREVVMA